MKILVVGVFNENSTNNGIANGFENAGHKVERYDYRERARAIGDYDRDEEILHLAKVNWYNLVFFCKCNGVAVDVVARFSDFDDCQTFLWYMDPLNGNYNDELKEKIKVADHVGVAKWEVYLEAKKLNPNTHFLIEGFDPAWDYPIECEKKYDVSFIGNPYGDRSKWLDAMNVNLNIFDGRFLPVKLLLNRFNIEHSKVVGETRVNMNLTGGGGISDRVYKILAAGGFCLSQSYPHVERYGLVLDEDLVLFNTPEEMIDKCNTYLSEPQLRNSIAQHGYETVQKFSRDNLAKQIIEIVK